MQIPADIPDHSYGWCRTSAPAWSQANARIYYTVQCYHPGGDLEYDLLYSVSSSGDNRLEANLPAIFPDDLFITIAGTHLTSNGHVIVATASHNVYITGGFTEHWRVLRVSSPNQVEIMVNPDTASPYPITTELSPDERRLALSSQWEDGYLVIVNLSSGQTTQFPTNLAGSICEMAWLNEQEILALEYIRGCNNVFRRPNAKLVFNIDTGASRQIAGQLDGIVWMLLRAETHLHGKVQDGGEYPLAILSEKMTTSRTIKHA